MEILNTRPITQVQDDTDRVIRSIDFLIPTYKLLNHTPDSSSPHDLPFKKTQAQLTQRYTAVEKCMRRLWQFWQKDYLTQLLKQNQTIHRQTKVANRDSPEVGEVVLIYDENAPRGHWKRALVLSTPNSRTNMSEQHSSNYLTAE